MREILGRFDDAADALFDRVRGNPELDRLFYGASALGEFSLLWVVAAIMRGVRGRPHDGRAALRALVALPLESLLVNGIVKSFFGRSRPQSDVVHPHPFRQPLTSSFPSGHATAGFCAAVLLSEEDELAPLYVAAAAVVAASRVHTKIHHASDVIGGAVIGTLLGILGRFVAPLERGRRR